MKRAQQNVIGRSVVTHLTELMKKKSQTQLCCGLKELEVLDSNSDE